MQPTNSIKIQKLHTNMKWLLSKTGNTLEYNA